MKDVGVMYDRQGRRLSMEEYAQLMERGFDYKRVREDYIGDRYWVSTVWLGLNHNWGDGPPLIFETMVFDQRKRPEGVGEDIGGTSRYATEAEAIAGHEQTVTVMRAVHEAVAAEERITDEELIEQARQAMYRGEGDST